ncbi:hypothetical protein MMMB2_0175 [Mycobacterium marinum MB2]|nr:hypothetical protein MMMB2_0175 [Mycobacterium marinum MB2]
MAMNDSAATNGIPDLRPFSTISRRKTRPIEEWSHPSISGAAS